MTANSLNNEQRKKSIFILSYLSMMKDTVNYVNKAGNIFGDFLN